MRILGSIVLGVLVAARAAGADPAMPHLRRQGTAIQLVGGTSRDSIRAPNRFHT